MHSQNIEKLQRLCAIVPHLLRQIPEVNLSSRPAPAKWSKKEILGHLIDSATSNHQRFIRAQFEDVPVISYDQNKWNECSYYNEIDSHQLIDFWTTYNLHLAALVSVIPADKLKRLCNTGGIENVTLEWLFNDYVSHLVHHLYQILPDLSPEL